MPPAANSKKKAERQRANRDLRAKAPLAAQFEDCLQACHKLSVALQDESARSKLFEVCKYCEARLNVWGDESGASSRDLDYVLRNSPLVKNQTLRLLGDFQRSLDEGEDCFHLLRARP
jgi:hypothetical protein